MRITDDQKRAVVPRLSGDWSLGALSRSMVAALEARKSEPPAWLRLLAAGEPTRKRRFEKATFGMG